MFSRPFINRIAFAGISWYAIIIVAAILIGYILSSKEARKQALPNDLMLDYLLLAIPLGILCARLYYVLFRFGDYVDEPLSILAIHEGGLAIYGGILGGLIAAKLTSRKHRVAFSQFLDILAPSLVLGQAIGRWGNYINMEAYGLRVSDEAFQFFPFAVEIPVGQVWYWQMATFFYEFCVDLVIFLLLLLIKKHTYKKGDVFLWYLLLYASARTVIEGLRDDSLTFISDFVRISQVLSGIFAFAIVVVFFLRIRDRLGLSNTLPLISAFLCFSLAFLGEFERNAYSTLFKYSQVLTIVAALLQAAVIAASVKDSGSVSFAVVAPCTICIAADLCLFLFGLNRANSDNTYYISFRQIAAMLQLCLCGWLLYFPFGIRQSSAN